MKRQSNRDCSYCTDSETLRKVMVRAFDLPASTVYLWRGGRYPGRCIVALKGHEQELFALTPRRRSEFMEDVNTIAAAVFRGFEADKVNYAVFGDLVPHLHFHVVPKHKKGSEWGAPFVVNSSDDAAMSPELIDRCLKILKKSAEFLGGNITESGRQPIAAARRLRK